MIEVLHVPDCPGLPLLLERLASVPVDGVVTRVIETEEQAVSSGMHGSPTLLVDGVDPFGDACATSGLCCRLYRDDGGRVDCAPSVDQLREALR